MIALIFNNIFISVFYCGILYFTLLYGKLRERARWAKSRAVIGYPSGQDRAILPAWDCPFCSRNKISPKSKQVYESFLSQNIFRDSKMIFCDFSVGMELENGKTETRYHFSYNWLPFQCSHINNYEDHFFSALYAIQ